MDLRNYIALISRRKTGKSGLINHAFYSNFLTFNSHTPNILNITDNADKPKRDQ